MTVGPSPAVGSEDPQGVEGEALHGLHIDWPGAAQRFGSARFGCSMGCLGAVIALPLALIAAWIWEPLAAPVVIIVIFSVWILGVLFSNNGPLKCPYCGKRVKIGADACHHCGRIVTAAEPG